MVTQTSLTAAMAMTMVTQMVMLRIKAMLMEMPTDNVMVLATATMTAAIVESTTAATTLCSTADEEYEMVVLKAAKDFQMAMVTQMAMA